MVQLVKLEWLRIRRNAKEAAKEEFIEEMNSGDFNVDTDEVLKTNENHYTVDREEVRKLGRIKKKSVALRHDIYRPKLAWFNVADRFCFGTVTGSRKSFSIMVKPQKCCSKLDEQLPGHWIGRRGPVEWPARSPDLTTHDFFFWDYIKSLADEEKIENVEHLKNRIIEACAKITPEMLQNVLSTFSIFSSYIAIVAAGGYAVSQSLVHDGAEFLTIHALYPFQRVLTTTALQHAGFETELSSFYQCRTV
ncbi:hypothetical protein ANN_04985 [Periplaneta americana]|uniref:Uncharacterized protein n=1 Tax=Periplaneta americana TaxID=6978 RepID=A0ABQ8TBQ1_PERAM|nr:hypothetical protein ANN_04985 [Periplaneta americana]